MGQWNITITGVGAHHNDDYPQDANRMARRFVEELRNAGHTVEHASFTHGGRDEYPDLRPCVCGPDEACSRCEHPKELPAGGGSEE